MQHTTLLQVFKVNDPRSGVKDGRAWDMQDAECALLGPDGVIEQVGVLRIPKDLRAKVAVGVFTAAFSLRANPKDRRIESILVDITPLPSKAARPAPSAA